MFHAILIGLLGAAIFSRVLFRRRMMRYAYGGGCPAGGYHGFHRHAHRHFGPFGGAWFRGSYRGGPGGGFAWRGFGGPMGWAEEGHFGDVAPPVPVDPARLDRALGELELNERQRAEIDESLVRLRESLGGELGAWQNLPAALEAVAAPEFDRARAEAAASHVSGGLRKEIVDGLEHFHNVLTAEQREKLLRIARS